jgi:hypothetical protein
MQAHAPPDRDRWLSYFEEVYLSPPNHGGHLRLRLPALLIPDTDSGHSTYAQITSEEKTEISHRGPQSKQCRKAWASDSPSPAGPSGS